MTIYIIAALLLALLQTWLIPASFNMKNFPWLGSNRDEPMPHELTLMAGRAMRANTNLQETLPIFLALACLLYTSPSPRDRQKSRMPSSA